jgi:putative transposase
VATLRDVVREPCLGDFDLDSWLWEDLTARAREQLQALLEASMETELTERLGYAPYQRDPAVHGDYRNGCYERALDTQFGPIRGLRVPRARQGGTGYRVLERYSRRAPWVNQLVQEMFLAGIGTRRVGLLVGSLLGASVSASAVSRVSRQLGERARAWHTRKLADDYRYLILDGVRVRIKGACGPVRWVALCVYGITLEGKREMIDCLPARGESEAEWVALLEDLRRRGLSGDKVELAITDGAQGLINALQFVFPRIPLQRCWAHKLRNVANCLPAKHRQACLRDAAAIYQAASRREALHLFRCWKVKWQAAAPKAVACLEKDLESLVTFFSQPKAHWKKIRTTNVIERQFREVRRRTNPMTCFVNQQSADRILFAIFHYANQRWAGSLLKEFTQKS